MTLESDSSALLLRALAFAAHKHRAQRRKGNQALPYVNHAIAVAAMLANEGGITDRITLCAAVLHDTLEDTPTTLTELVSEFGEEIAAVVREVTDDKSLPRADRKRLQIEHAPHISARARLVKLADKICNVRDMVHSPPTEWAVERRQEYCEWAKRVVDALRGTHAQLEAMFDAAYEARPR